MTRWYDDLVQTPRDAAEVLRCDYGSIAAVLRGVSGAVLDLGGGCGVARHFLGRDTEYVVLDPSTEWLRPAWQIGIAKVFPCQATPPTFVCGIGERMPFGAASFDVVLALWSLNHVGDLAASLGEVRRVLAPGGRAVLVLEDMEPRWWDLRRGEYLPPGGATHGEIAIRKLAARLGGRPWPTQTDHIPIREPDLRRLIRLAFRVESRTWARHYLVYELRLRPKL